MELIFTIIEKIGIKKSRGKNASLLKLCAIISIPHMGCLRRNLLVKTKRAWKGHSRKKWAQLLKENSSWALIMKYER